ncbi:MAG: PEP-CTERM sorting domain-containing protein [Verrucomicrobiota bacterium]
MKKPLSLCAAVVLLFTGSQAQAVETDIFLFIDPGTGEWSWDGGFGINPSGASWGDLADATSGTETVNFFFSASGFELPIPPFTPVEFAPGTVTDQTGTLTIGTDDNDVIKYVALDLDSTLMPAYGDIIVTLFNVVDPEPFMLDTISLNNASFGEQLAQTSPTGGNFATLDAVLQPIPEPTSFALLGAAALLLLYRRRV